MCVWMTITTKELLHIVYLVPFEHVLEFSVKFQPHTSPQCKDQQVYDQFKNTNIAALYRNLTLELKSILGVFYFRLFWPQVQRCTLCRCRWFAGLPESESSLSFWSSPRPEGLKDGPEKPAASDYYFSEGHRQGETIEKSVESPPPCRPPVGPPECCDSHTHTQSAVPHCLFVERLPVGRPLDLLSHLEDTSPVDYVSLQLREGLWDCSGWRKCELKSRRGALGKFTLACVWERDGVFPNAPAGQQVTQKWEGITDIPEKFPIKISTLVVEPACWHLFMSAWWQPN